MLEDEGVRTLIKEHAEKVTTPIRLLPGDWVRMQLLRIVGDASATNMEKITAGRIVLSAPLATDDTGAEDKVDNLLNALAGNTVASGDELVASILRYADGCKGRVYIDTLYQHFDISRAGQNRTFVADTLREAGYKRRRTSQGRTFWEKQANE